MTTQRRNQVTDEAKRLIGGDRRKYVAHLDFARDMAAIYASLSKRQQRLGDEFEAAIFDDLVSLYES